MGGDLKMEAQRWLILESEGLKRLIKDTVITLRTKNHPWPHRGQSQEFAQLNQNPSPPILILPNPPSAHVLYKVLQRAPVPNEFLKLSWPSLDPAWNEVTGLSTPASLSQSLRAMRKLYSLTRQPWPSNINNQAAEAVWSAGWREIASFTVKDQRTQNSQSHTNKGSVFQSGVSSTFRIRSWSFAKHSGCCTMLYEVWIHVCEAFITCK